MDDDRETRTAPAVTDAPPVAAAPATPVPASTAAQPTPVADAPQPGLRHAFHRTLVIAGILTLLAVIGLFWTNVRPSDAFWYWAAMFPAFGLISIGHTIVWRRNAVDLRWFVVRQVLHWLGSVLAVWILFLQLRGGQIGRPEVGLTTLLLLASSCYLAGVHLDPSFLWVSVLLALGVLLGTALQAYLWLIVILGVVAIVAIVGGIFLMRRGGEATAP